MKFSTEFTRLFELCLPSKSGTLTIMEMLKRKVAEALLIHINFGNSFMEIHNQDETVYEPNEMINEYWMKNVQFDWIALGGFVLGNNVQWKQQRETVSDACNSRNKWASAANKGIFFSLGMKTHHFSPSTSTMECLPVLSTDIKIIEIVNTPKNPMIRFDSIRFYVYYKLHFIRIIILAASFFSLLHISWVFSR